LNSFHDQEIKPAAAETGISVSAAAFCVFYMKDLGKHWKNIFFCAKIDHKSVLWNSYTGNRYREMRKGKGRIYEPGSSNIEKRRRQIPEIRRPLGI
jgi:hypothetical protein